MLAALITPVLKTALSKGLLWWYNNTASPLLHCENQSLLTRTKNPCIRTISLKGCMPTTCTPDLSWGKIFAIYCIFGSRTVLKWFICIAKTPENARNKYWCENNLKTKQIYDHLSVIFNGVFIGFPLDVKAPKSMVRFIFF